MKIAAQTRLCLALLLVHDFELQIIHWL